MTITQENTLVEKFYWSNERLVKIFADPDPQNPRESGEGFLGTLVCWHNRYKLGDKHDFKGAAHFMEWWVKHGNKGVLMPLYLYDHSGITMSTEPFSCPWDSGQVGYAYVTGDKIRKRYAGRFKRRRGLNEIYTLVRKIVKKEVAAYDQYLRGEYYGYTVEKDGEVLDSCWGFDDLEYCKKEAKKVCTRRIGGASIG